MTDEELEKKAEAYADEHFEYTDFDCIDHDKWEDCQNSWKEPVSIGGKKC